MRYKIIKDVELDKKVDYFVNTSAQCMLKLLMNRINKDEFAEHEIDDDFDIDFDFAMYGSESVKVKQDLGYTNDKFKDSAESYVRGL